DPGCAQAPGPHLRHPGGHRRLLHPGKRRRAEGRDDAGLQKALVPDPGLRLHVRQPAEPALGPVGHGRPPEPRVDPLAAGLVGLHRGGEPVGVGLPPEGLRPLPPVGREVADLVPPVAVLLLRKGSDVGTASNLLFPVAPRGGCRPTLLSGSDGQHGPARLSATRSSTHASTSATRYRRCRPTLTPTGPVPLYRHWYSVLTGTLRISATSSTRSSRLSPVSVTSTCIRPPDCSPFPHLCALDPLERDRRPRTFRPAPLLNERPEKATKTCRVRCSAGHGLSRRASSTPDFVGGHFDLPGGGQ